MQETMDSLKVKIEKAKTQLPKVSRDAVDAVDWRASILGLKEKRGYTFEQLEDLETETELVLCGILNGQEYKRELESRMRISHIEANQLVNEMNELVFKKIRQELIKNLANQEEATKKPDQEIEKGGNLLEEREEILSKIEKPEIVHSILAQKLSGSVSGSVVKTEHTLENITKTNTPSMSDIKPKIRSVDPYREIPE